MSSKTKKPLAAVVSSRDNKVDKAPAAPKAMKAKPEKAKPAAKSNTGTVKMSKPSAREVDPAGKETVLVFSGSLPKRAAMVQASLKITETYVSSRQKK